MPGSTHNAVFNTIFDVSRLALKRIWKQFTQYFRVSFEPQITQKRDQSGNEYWTVYDPNSDRYSTFRTIDEVLIWIEERYRR